MYTTLTRVLYEDKGAEAGAAVPGAVSLTALFTAIQKVTARIKAIAWDFEPHYGTEYFTAGGDNVNISWGELVLTNPKGQQLLLASATDVPVIMLNGQAITFGLTSASSPVCLPYPQNYTPIKALRLNDANYSIWRTWYPTCLPWIDNITVTGFWGYRKDYSNAFIDSLDSVQDALGINATVTTITVTNVSGADALFWSPRFDAGNLIRIDNELILILATNTTANTLSVRRGVNGTTKAAHALNTDITIWYPETDLMDTVSRQAAYFYSRRGSYEAIAVQGVATAVYPPDMVDELWAMLQGYQNE